MKKIKLVGLAALSAIMMLTSCLGDSHNEQDYVNLPGVFRNEGTKLVLDTRLGPVYSPKWMAYGYADHAVLASFHINYDSDENANAVENKYYTVTVTYEPVTLDEQPTWPYVDTTSVIPNEFALKKGVYGMGDPYLADYIDGKLFLTSHFESLTDQENYWRLMLDVNQEPTTYNGKNVYAAYIRGAIGKEGKTPKVENMLDMRVHDIEDEINQLSVKEKGKEAFYLQFHYVSEIKEGEKEGDPVKLIWTKQEDYLGFAVPTDDK